MIGQLLPASMQTVRYGDGSTGFLDPSDGTYYDSQGNDVTGYVQNYGGAAITGTATAAQIQSAEGISSASASVSNALQSIFSPSPRVTVPSGVQSSMMMGGSSMGLLLFGGLGLVLVMMMGKRR